MDKHSCDIDCESANSFVWTSSGNDCVCFTFFQNWSTFFRFCQTKCRRLEVIFTFHNAICQQTTALLSFMFSNIDCWRKRYNVMKCNVFWPIHSYQHTNRWLLVLANKLSHRKSSITQTRNGKTSRFEFTTHAWRPNASEVWSVTVDCKSNKRWNTSHSMPAWSSTWIKKVEALALQTK